MAQSGTGNTGFELSDVKPVEAPQQVDSDLVENLKARIAAQEEQLRALGSVGGTQSHASTKKRIRIRIDEARDSSEPNPVFVGVDGRGYQIRRGVEVDVPPEVAHVLDIAIAGRGVPRGGGGTDFVQGRRIPYQVLGIAVNEAGERLLPLLDYQAKTSLS